MTIAPIARTIGGGLAAAALVLSTAAPAGAQTSTLSANLEPLNRSGADGSATVSLEGNQVRVTVTTTGVSPTLPHAQHIHIGEQGTCPPPGAGSNQPPEDLISTAEGKPFYGAVKVSLTTTGDVGEQSALAVERFPTADASGSYTYTRSFDLPPGTTADDVRTGVIVVHGISTLFGDPAKYDGEPRSSLDPSLPLEATIPSLCGKLVAAQTGDVPRGGVAAGGGATAGQEAMPLIPAGAAALLGIVAFMTQRRIRLLGR